MKCQRFRKCSATLQLLSRLLHHISSLTNAWIFWLYKSHLHTWVPPSVSAWMYTIKKHTFDLCHLRVSEMVAVRSSLLLGAWNSRCGACCPLRADKIVICALWHDTTTIPPPRWIAWPGTRDITETLSVILAKGNVPSPGMSQCQPWYTTAPFHLSLIKLGFM